MFTSVGGGSLLGLDRKEEAMDQGLLRRQGAEEVRPLVPQGGNPRVDSGSLAALAPGGQQRLLQVPLALSIL